MRKTSKFLVILGTALLIGIGAFSFYQKEKTKDGPEKYIPINHSDRIFSIIK